MKVSGLMNHLVRNVGRWMDFLTGRRKKMNLRRLFTKKACKNCKYWDLWTIDGPCVTCMKDGVLTKWEARVNDVRL